MENQNFTNDRPKKKRKTLHRKINGPDETEVLVPRSAEEKKVGQRIVVVLEAAFLELVQLKKNFDLLNVDDHKTLMLKNKRELGDARPDVAHQALMSLLDSPLNKAGKLVIYLHTAKNVLIEIHPSLRIPRTFKRFCGLMIELLQKNKIKSSTDNETLLRVISNPVTKYLPVGGRRIGFSVKGKPIELRSFVEGFKTETQEAEKKFIPPVFIIGAVAMSDPVEDIRFGGDYVEEKVQISPYPLSAACCCTKLCHEFEQLWGVNTPK